MSSFPIFLSPATPSDLLTSIIGYSSFPTTLIIGCSRESFQDALLQSVATSMHRAQDSEHLHTSPTKLVTASLCQTAVAKHIRMLFVPSVTHLRAYLPVFTPDDSKTTAPPSEFEDAITTPLLVLYGLLDLHRDSSEWSAQGLGFTTALLIEAAKRTGFRAVLVEPTDEEGHPGFSALLAQEIPLLGIGGAEAALSGRNVEVKRVLGRWFVFEEETLGNAVTKKPAC